MIEILREQIARHPSMKPQDAMKLCYQSVFGAEHLLEDQEAAKEWFFREFEQVQPTGEEPLGEDVSSSHRRVNMGAWKARGLPPEWLFWMFVETASVRYRYLREEWAPRFENAVQGIGDLVAEGAFGFDMEVWEEYLKGYPLTKPVPVHHSEAYRQAEKPAYRLVVQDYYRLIHLLEFIWKKHEERGVGRSGSFVVAIDGPCASGKTTLAERLAQVTGAGIVHMDDFFLPMELRTKERLGEPGGNVHYERFKEEVLPALERGVDFSYRRFDCGKMELMGERQVCGADIAIVEGSYSCHTKFGDYMDVRVFCHVCPKEQLARIARRDGADAVEMFKQCWIPMEEAYLEAYHIREQADFEMGM